VGHCDLVSCRCVTLTELSGAEAAAYAAEHLQETTVDSGNWTRSLVCPETGERFLMDYPESGAHGGGPPRLRPLGAHGE
jgi:hypothetical protein